LQGVRFPDADPSCLKEGSMFGLDRRTAKAVWTAFVVALMIYIIYAIRSTLLLLTFAVFFSYLVYPLVRLIERHKPTRLSRTAVIALVFALVIAAALIVIILFGQRMIEEAATFAQQLPRLLDPANVVTRIPLPDFLKPLRPRLLNLLTEALQSGAGPVFPVMQQFGRTLIRAASNMLYVVLVPIISFFLIKDAPAMRAKALSWAGKANGGIWITIARDLHLLLAGFVRALLLLALATFISYSVAFEILAVPYSLFFAGMSAALEFIPVIGPLTSVLVVLTVSAFTGYAHLLWLAAFFIVYRIFQDYVLSPLLMSEEAELTPLLVIIGLLAGERLGGIAGMFLSVPVLAAIKIILIRSRAFELRR
jgi:predicted PurR-regulated permease PerM